MKPRLILCCLLAAICSSLAGESIEQSLLRLESLLDKRLITQEDYANQKAELLKGNPLGASRSLNQAAGSNTVLASTLGFDSRDYNACAHALAKSLAEHAGRDLGKVIAIGPAVVTTNFPAEFDFQALQELVAAMVFQQSTFKISQTVRATNIVHSAGEVQQFVQAVRRLNDTRDAAELTDERPEGGVPRPALARIDFALLVSLSCETEKQPVSETEERRYSFHYRLVDVNTGVVRCSDRMVWIKAKRGGERP